MLAANPHARAERLQRQMDPNFVAGSAELVSISKSQGVAVITINNPPVNAFSPAVKEGIRAAYKNAIADSSVKAIVFTGQGGFFMAGADIAHLQKSQQNAQSSSGLASFIRDGNELFNAIEKGSKPCVAAINGPAFGGGLELAMACNGRVAVKSAKFGLPELSLGIIPGLGGTQRLPRLIGVKAAVDATLKSKNFNAQAAQKLGLIDAIVDPKALLVEAGKLALGIAAGKVPRRISLEQTSKLGEWVDDSMVIDSTRTSLRKKAKNTPHPWAYLDAVEAGVKNGGKAGLDVEMAKFAECLVGQVSKSLIHVFFAQRQTSKIPGLKPTEAAKAPIKTVAVLGGGTMGSGIALVYLMNGFDVIMKEVNEKYLKAAVDRMVDIIMRTLKRQRLPEMGIEQIMRNFTPQITYDNFDKVDLVVEAVIEDIPIKQKIFSDLERLCKPNCILATNTSSIDIELVGANTKAQDRIIGLHFFSPAHMMPLLEIVRTKHTSADTIARSLTNAKKIKKTPVVVGNCVGFTANRIFSPYGQAANLLVESGIDLYKLDTLVEQFGMPMGPFKMNDLSGIDIGMHVGTLISGAYSDRMMTGSLTKKFFESKPPRLGQKTGAGYYKYVKNKPQPDPKGIAPYLDAARAEAKAAGITAVSLTDEEIVQAVLFPVVNESCRVLAEGHVVRSSDIDMCAIMGYGFPSWRGGPMFWAQSDVGLKKVAEKLQYFADKFGKNSPAAKRFFAPSPALLELAKKSK